GILGLFPDGALRLQARPTRATVLAWIARIAQNLETWQLERAIFRGAQGNTLSVSQKGNIPTHPVTPGLCLYRSIRGRSYPVSRLTLDVGDEVNFHLNPSGAVDVLILSGSTLGAADDRSSPYYRW